MKATKSGSFKAVPLPEPQTTLARCYSVIDIGTTPDIYKGKQNPRRKFVRKIRITWELPAHTAVFNEEKGPEPFVVGVEVSASTSDNSALSKLISAWRNKPLTLLEQEGFDPGTMVGKTGMISFIHVRKADYRGKEISEITNENTVLKLNAITSKPKAVEAPPNRNSYMYWDWDEVATKGFEALKEKFESIPLWIQKKCAESKEFKQYAGSYKIKGTEEEGETQESQPEEQTAKKTVAGDDW